jgi:hypothetical protein
MVRGGAVMMTEKEIIEFAKQNDYCWAGLQRRHPEVAEWMIKHNDYLIVLCNEGVWRPNCGRVSGVEIYRLRLDYKPKQPKEDWRVYDIKAIDGRYHVLMDNNKVPLLVSASCRVGFGGVQFEGQEYDHQWYLCIVGAISEDGWVSAEYEGVNDPDKPAVPIRARFWEGE